MVLSLVATISPLINLSESIGIFRIIEEEGEGETSQDRNGIMDFLFLEPNDADMMLFNRNRVQKWLGRTFDIDVRESCACFMSFYIEGRYIDASE